MKAIFISMVICVLLTINTYSRSNYYIIMNDSTFNEIENLEMKIETIGGKINHIFPRGEFICYLPEERANSIKICFDCRLEGLNSIKLNISDRIGYRSWENLRTADKTTESIQGISRDSSGSLFKCGFRRYELPADYNQDKNAVKTPVTNRITNNFMIGRVAVGIVLMESTGNLLNWSHEEENEAIAEAVEGYEYLTEQAEMHNVDLSWVYEIHRNVLTSEEPILTYYPYNTGFPDFNWRFGWIDDALEYLEAGEEWDGIFNYANEIRSKYKTNWAFSLFIVKNDSSYSKFPNDALGYTVSYEEYPGQTIRPPFAVSTYLYKGYSANLSSRVVAHESAHVFGAMDEYVGSSQCGDSDDCNEVGGYLRYPNMNCYYCGIFQPCLMRVEPYMFDICPYTAGHLGWIDSDGDGAPNPIDPNSNRWSIVPGAKSGDLVRIFTIDNDFVNSIACTAENTGAGDWILWDGRNYDNQDCVITYYNATINSGSPFTIYLQEANMSIQPMIANLSDQNGLISWDLEESFAYLTCELYDYADSLIARPFWNKFYGVGNYEIDISDIYCSTYRIKLSGWRPDGGLSNISGLNIEHDDIIAPSYISALNHFEHQSVKIAFNDINHCEEGWIIERRSLSSQEWIIIDTLDKNDYEYVYYEDYYPVGGETYTYRVKGFTENQQNAPYSDEATVTTRPHHAEDIFVYSTDFSGGVPTVTGCGDVPLKIGSGMAVAGKSMSVIPEELLDNEMAWQFLHGNDITVKWIPSSDQKYPIVDYYIRLTHPNVTMGDIYEVGLDTCFYICPVDVNSTYSVYVYGISSIGDTSLPISRNVSTGDMNVCPGNATKGYDDGETCGDSPDKITFRNYPNPFNPETVFSFALPEVANVNLSIFNILGQRIATLIDKTMPAGEHQILWGGFDSENHQAASGIYFARFTAGDFIETRKIIIMR